MTNSCGHNFKIGKMTERLGVPVDQIIYFDIVLTLEGNIMESTW